METEECRICRRARLEKLRREKNWTIFRRGCMGILIVVFTAFAGGWLGYKAVSLIPETVVHEELGGVILAEDHGTGKGQRVYRADTLALEESTAESRQVTADVAAVYDGEELPVAFSQDGAETIATAYLGGAIPVWVLPDGETGIMDRLIPLKESLTMQMPLFEAHSTVDTVGFGENIISRYGIMIDVEDGVILAEKDAEERMNPASMTKILTVLVAAEHVSEEALADMVSITIDITDYCYIHGCSITGYGLGESVTVKDLFYGTILPSGADSAMALAAYVAGSQEAFVEMMNDKLTELDMAETTHVTNCIGLYDENHYSTAYDMARILKAAMDNPLCRDVLSTHIYTTSSTEQHPEGLRVSNKFLRRIEDVDTHGEVLCAKTGFVNQSGSCAASFCLGNDGREYLCVTAGSTSSQNCIADQAELYRTFIPE